jgi:hypothetical protein
MGIDKPDGKVLFIHLGLCLTASNSALCNPLNITEVDGWVRQESTSTLQ